MEPLPLLPTMYYTTVDVSKHVSSLCCPPCITQRWMSPNMYPPSAAHHVLHNGGCLQSCILTLLPTMYYPTVDVSKHVSFTMYITFHGNPYVCTIFHRDSWQMLSKDFSKYMSLNNYRQTNCIIVAALLLSVYREYLVCP